MGLAGSRLLGLVLDHVGVLAVDVEVAVGVDRQAQGDSALAEGVKLVIGEPAGEKILTWSAP